MANVDETWYWELEDPETYYTGVSALQLMEHLRLRSGGRHAIDAVDIIAETGPLFAEAHSIAEYINAMEELQEKSLRSDLPIADEMLLAIATKAVPTI